MIKSTIKYLGKRMTELKYPSSAIDTIFGVVQWHDRTSSLAPYLDSLVDDNVIQKFNKNTSTIWATLHTDKDKLRSLLPVQSLKALASCFRPPNVLIYSSHISHVKHLCSFPFFTDLGDPQSVLSCKVLFNGLVCFQWNRLEKIGSEIKVVGENNIFPICARMFSLIDLHRVLICWLFQCQKLQLVHWVHKASFQQLADFSVPLSRIRAMCSWRQDHEEFVFCHWNDLNILFKPVWQDGSSPYVPWEVVRMLFFSPLHR